MQYDTYLYSVLTACAYVGSCRPPVRVKINAAGPSLIDISWSDADLNWPEQPHPDGYEVRFRQRGQRYGRYWPWASSDWLCTATIQGQPGGKARRDYLGEYNQLLDKDSLTQGIIKPRLLNGRPVWKQAGRGQFYVYYCIDELAAMGGDDDDNEEATFWTVGRSLGEEQDGVFLQAFCDVKTPTREEFHAFDITSREEEEKERIREVGHS